MLFPEPPLGGGEVLRSVDADALQFRGHDPNGDAVPELDEVADWRTRTPGGHGAVCEVIRELLSAQDKLDAVLEVYRR